MVWILTDALMVPPFESITLKKQGSESGNEQRVQSDHMQCSGKQASKY